MPDLKEKLVELIDYAKQIAGAKCHGYVLCNNCPNKKYEGRCKDIFMVEELIANGVTIQKWIPVSERLPEECGFYICFFQSPYGNGCWRVGQCHWNEESWVRIGAVPPHVIVTHWMPLPHPPKENEYE